MPVCLSEEVVLHCVWQSEGLHLFSFHLLTSFLCGSERVTEPFSASQEIPHPAKVAASEDSHRYSSVGPPFPCCTVPFLPFSPFNNLRAGERQTAGRGSYSSNPRHKQFRGRQRKTEQLLCHTSNSSGDLKSHHVFHTINQLQKHPKGAAIKLSPAPET